MARYAFVGDVKLVQTGRLLVDFGDGATVPVVEGAAKMTAATFERLVKLRDYARAHPELQVPADLLL